MGIGFGFIRNNLKKPSQSGIPSDKPVVSPKSDNESLEKNIIKESDKESEVLNFTWEKTDKANLFVM